MAGEMKVVGEIRPDPYRDPVQMLRNLADGVEAGEYGDISTVGIVALADEGIHVFGGGRVSDTTSIVGALQIGCVTLVRMIGARG